MKYQYEILKEEVQRYSSELAGRNHAIAITKIDALSVDEVNLLTEIFLEDIGLKANSVLKKYKADMNYLSYGYEKDEWDEYPEGEAGFVLPISSVGQFNTEALRYALADFSKAESQKSAKREAIATEEGLSDADHES